MKKTFIFSILICHAWITKAAHIVGGNVSYTYNASTNTYKIKFLVYRDCELNANGTQKTGFDGDPANAGNPNASLFHVTIMDLTTNTTELRQLTFSYKNKVKLDNINPCADSNLACVEEAYYETTWSPPVASRSYAVMHSRCCRNNGIANLEDIAGTGGSNKPGMTIYAIIPPTNTYANNSASFKKFPPLFLCNNQQVFFDHSATDPDGDVLRYYLVTPLNGGSTASPIVQSVPLSELTNYANWLSPYSLNDVLGGSPVLKIDPITGLLTCKPNTAGRFIVSVMVKEFRNGVAIDSAIRDFQFNVVNCEIPISDFPVIPGTYDVNTGVGDYKINCKNKTVDFTLNSTNAKELYWNFGDPNSGASNTSSVQSPTHTFSDTGTFLVRLISYAKDANNNLICPDTIKRRVKVYPSLTSNFNFNSPAFCAGSPIQFSDLSSGTSGNPNDWKWDFGNGASSTAQNPSYLYPSSGSFSVKLTVKSSKQCEADTALNIAIYPKPIISANIPNTCLNQLALLTCNVTVPTPSVISNYRWTLPDGSKINTCNTSFIPTTIGGAALNLWAKTDKGCVDSQNYNYTVFPKPIIRANNDTTICYNKSVKLSSSGGVSYLWTPPTYLDNPSTQNPTASPIYPNSIQYSVKGTDGNGCYDFDTVNISFFNKPNISAGLDTSVCLFLSKFRDSVRLNGQGNFSTVYWTPTTSLSNPNILNPMSKPSVNMEYILHGIDVNSCIIEDTMVVYVLNPNLDIIRQKDTTKCYYDTIQIIPVDQGIITKYIWRPGLWLSDSNARAPYFSTRVTTLYELYIENYCYDKKDSITIKVPLLPDANMPLKDSICSGDIYQFNLNPIHTYVWNTLDTSLSSSTIANPSCHPTITTNYYITITDQYGCKNYDFMPLIVNYPPHTTILGLKPYLCKGSSLWLMAVTDVPAKFKWWDNTYIYPKDDSAQVYVNPPATTQYFIKASSADNCFRIDSFIVHVEEPIIPQVQSPFYVCKGKYINLNVSGGLYYHWGPNYNINDTFAYNPQVFPDTTFQYRVHISNNCFNDDTTVLVIVDTLPKIYRTPDTQIFRGETITLEAKSAANTFEWSPKESISFPFIERIEANPVETTVYRISVKDGKNCEGIDSVIVRVVGKDILLLPSGFSPNGDGINDYFRILKHLNLRQLNSFEIYNRWGEIVFKAKTIEDQWDGLAGGRNCPLGTYIWSIEFVNHEGEKIKKSGNVELIR